MPPNLFYKVSITLIPKPGKDTTKKETTDQFPPMSIEMQKFSIKYLYNKFHNTFKKSYIVVSCFPSRDARIVQ
jgi:hypothetical protein